MAVYLDWNATAPLRPEAKAAILHALDGCGNPSSVHAFGRAARRRIEDARTEVARLVGSTPAEIVFTGGGTEANNAALRGSGGGLIALLATEHASVREAAGEDAVIIPVDRQGLVDTATLDRVLAVGGIGLLCVQAVNNETGVVQPLDAVVSIADRYGVPVHCDAVQAVGRIPFDFTASGLASASLSAHKIGGPQGVGALVLRDGRTVPPLLRGGGQERRRRAGTENVAGIAAFGAAATAAAAGLAAYAGLAGLRDGLESWIRAAAAEAVVFGQGVDRVANTSCIALPGVTAESQLMGFDLAGVAVSAGAACSSGKVAASHVLLAMGADPELAGCAIRVSIGPTTTEFDLRRFHDVWLELRARRGRGRAAA